MERAATTESGHRTIGQMICALRILAEAGRTVEFQTRAVLVRAARKYVGISPVSLSCALETGTGVCRPEGTVGKLVNLDWSWTPRPHR